MVAQNVDNFTLHKNATTNKICRCIGRIYMTLCINIKLYVFPKLVNKSSKISHNISSGNSSFQKKKVQFSQQVGKYMTTGT